VQLGFITAHAGTAAGEGAELGEAAADGLAGGEGEGDGVGLSAGLGVSEATSEGEVLGSVAEGCPPHAATSRKAARARSSRFTGD